MERPTTGLLREPFYFPPLSRRSVMNRVAVFVDAGYLFAQGSVLLFGQKLPRGALSLNSDAALLALSGFATRLTNLPLLRTYWYDGTSIGPTAQHTSIAQLPNVKVRLGFVNSAGEQKGVDSLIVTDMIALARNRAMAEAVLLSGDEDLRVGVQQAQELGVRVHLLGIAPCRGNQSPFLIQEADTAHEWRIEDLVPFMSCRASAPQGSDATDGPLSKGASSFREVADQIASEIAGQDLESLLLTSRQTRQIPKDLDGRLLARGRTQVGTNLSMAQKREIRDLFLRACEARLAGRR